MCHNYSFFSHIIIFENFPNIFLLTRSFSFLPSAYQKEIEAPVCKARCLLLLWGLIIRKYTLTPFRDTSYSWLTYLIGTKAFGLMSFKLSHLDPVYFNENNGLVMNACFFRVILYSSDLSNSIFKVTRQIDKD